MIVQSVEESGLVKYFKKCSDKVKKYSQNGDSRRRNRTGF